MQGHSQDIGKHLDSYPFHADHIRRCVRANTRRNGGRKIGVVVRHENATSEDTEEEEEGEAEEDALDCLGDSDSWSHCLTGTHGYELGSSHRVCSDLEDGPETKESTPRAGGVVLGPWSRLHGLSAFISTVLSTSTYILPVTEADTVMDRVPAEHDHERHEN